MIIMVGMIPGSTVIGAMELIGRHVGDGIILGIIVITVMQDGLILGLTLGIMAITDIDGDIPITMIGDGVILIIMVAIRFIVA